MSSFDANLKAFDESELASGRKVFFPTEPATNRDGLRTPNFIASASDADANQSKNGIFNRIRTALSGPDLGPNERFLQAELDAIMGNLNNAVTAKFFVIHDRGVDNAAFNPANITHDMSGVHLFMDHLNHFHMNRDYDQAGNATKFESALQNNTDPRFVNNALWPAGVLAFRNRTFQGAPVRSSEFIHVELTRTTAGDRVRANPDRVWGYTRKQIFALALAYVTASLRRGAFLTVTAHREVDRGLNSIRGNLFRWAHDDPRNFDIRDFYRTVNQVLFGFGFGTDRATDFAGTFTYGIDAARMAIDNAGNFSNSLHTFPNQYGARQAKPNNWNNPNTVVIRCGGNNFRIVDPIIPNPGGMQLRRSEAYIFGCGGPFLQQIVP